MCTILASKGYEYLRFCLGDNMDLVKRVKTPYAVTAMAVDHNGSRVAVANAFKSEVLVFNIETGNQEATLAIDACPFESHTLSWNSRYLTAVAESGNKVYIWDNNLSIVHIENVWPCTVRQVIESDDTLILLLKLPYTSFMKANNIDHLDNIRTIRFGDSISIENRNIDGFENLSGVFSKSECYFIGNRMIEGNKWELSAITPNNGYFHLEDFPADRVKTSKNNNTGEITVLGTVRNGGRDGNSLFIINKDDSIVRYHLNKITDYSIHEIAPYKDSFVLMVSDNNDHYLLYDIYSEEHVYEFSEEPMDILLYENGMIIASLENIIIFLK